MSKHFGNEKEILSGVLSVTNSYSFPKGLEDDQMHHADGPIQDDPTLDGYNADAKAAQLINYA